jgi:hypothetical protein
MLARFVRAQGVTGETMMSESMLTPRNEYVLSLDRSETSPFTSEKLLVMFVEIGLPKGVVVRPAVVAIRSLENKKRDDQL